MSSSSCVEDILEITSVEGGWCMVGVTSAVTSDATSFGRYDMPMEMALHLEDLPAIEKDLWPEDAARLLFLIVDDVPACVLQQCVLRMRRPQQEAPAADSFSAWARRSEVAGVPWQRLFLEALAMVGRLDVLVTLGLTSGQVEDLLKPLYTPKQKIVLNTVCDQLVQAELLRLAQYISEEHLKSRAPPALPDGFAIKQLMELYLLYWMQERVLELSDLTPLADGLHHIGRPKLAHLLLGKQPLEAGAATGAGGRNSMVRQPSSGVSWSMSVTPGDDSKWYPNGSGLCVIFNQEQFVCCKDDCNLRGANGHSRRLGSDRDANNLEKLFSGFRCRTKVFFSLPAQDIEERLCNLSNANDLGKYDFLVICFLSHGGMDERGHYIFSSDCKRLWLDKLVSNFNGNRCPALAGRLKLVVTQACQGDNSLRPVHVVTDGPCDPPPSQPPTSVLSPLSDFLFCQATTPGYKAYRNEQLGSFYVNTLCGVLHMRGHLEELTHCVKDVHNQMMKNPVFLEEGGQQCAMQPQIIDRTTGRFMFKRTVHTDGNESGAPMSA